MWSCLELSLSSLIYSKACPHSCANEIASDAGFVLVEVNCGNMFLFVVFGVENVGFLLNDLNTIELIGRVTHFMKYVEYVVGNVAFFAVCKVETIEFS